MGRYTYIEHTADLGINVSGGSFEDILITIARAIVETQVTGQIKERVQRTITCSGDTLEDLLVDWCRELLYLYEVHEFIPASYAITKKNLCVTAHLHGEMFDSTRHSLKTHIKNVTYHDLSITHTSTGYSTTVIFAI